VMDWIKNLKKKVKDYFSNMYKKNQNQTDEQLAKQGYTPKQIGRLRNRAREVEQQDALFKQMRKK
jgi:hypothetical protein